MASLRTESKVKSSGAEDGQLSPSAARGVEDRLFTLSANQGEGYADVLKVGDLDEGWVSCDGDVDEGESVDRLSASEAGGDHASEAVAPYGARGQWMSSSSRKNQRAKAYPIMPIRATPCSFLRAVQNYRGNRSA